MKNIFYIILLIFSFNTLSSQLIIKIDTIDTSKMPVLFAYISVTENNSPVEQGRFGARQCDQKDRSKGGHPRCCSIFAVDDREAAAKYEELINKYY